MNKRRISSNVLNWLNTFKRNRKISSGKKITNIELRYYAEMLFPALISVIAGYYLWRYKLASLYSTEIPNFLLVSALFFCNYSCLHHADRYNGDSQRSYIFSIRLSVIQEGVNNCCGWKHLHRNYCRSL